MQSASRHGGAREIVDRAIRAARGVPGVDEVVVHVRERREAGPAAHVGDAGPQQSAETRVDRPQAEVHGIPLVLPADAPTTLVDALLRASADGSERGTTYVLADDREDRQTYRQLLTDAAAVLTGLRSRGLRPGDSVLLHCDNNRNFVTGFWACLLGGFVPTPIGMVATYRWDNAVTRRMHNAWELLDRAPVLTDAVRVGEVAHLRELWATQELVVLGVEDMQQEEPAIDLHPASPDDPAVHLLTSGSTGVPKCVRQTHRSVIRRAYANSYANGFTSDDVTLNFMPLDHVAGMVMHNVRDVILRCEHVNARTDQFIADPLRWLTWIERYQATNTSAPNFVITLVTKLADEVSRRRWDLSSLRDITNGGEAIVSRTMHEFLQMLAPHGLATDVMRPAWGMSEFCGGVVHSTMRGDDESIGVVTVDSRPTDGPLRILPGPTPGHATYTEVGLPVAGVSVRIVGPTGQVLPEDHVGRLHVRGDMQMVGYHRNPEANQAVFTADRWIDTGDLAFVHRGRLAMTGREKDVLVVRSANYPCHEIESVVERTAGVRPTFVAACSEHDAETGTDELVIFCVLTVDDPTARRRIVRDISATLSKEVGLRPRRVVLVPTVGDFPKTSAGKIERARLLSAYQAGHFDAHVTTFGVAASGTQLRFDEEHAGPAWMFRTVWATAAERPGAAPDGAWLVLHHGDLTEPLRRLRGTDAHSVIGVTPGDGFARRSKTDFELDPTDAEQYSRLLTTVEEEHGRIGQMVHAWAVAPGGDQPQDYTRALDLSVLSVHRLIKAGGQRGAPLLVVSRGACPTAEADPVEPVYATVSALVRTARTEQPDRWIRHLDLNLVEPDPVDRAASSVFAEVHDHGDHSVVAYRWGNRLVPRLQPLTASRTSRGQEPRHGGLYLVTGGLGEVGHTICRTLLERYGATLLITGRAEPTGGAADRLAELADLGTVVYRRADVADEGALHRVVDTAERTLGRTLDGVVHIAGAEISSYFDDLASHLLLEEDTAEFSRMFHAKVYGTRAVASVLENRPDAMLVLFSSVNAYFGGAAFGAYASANAFLPAFAAYWRGRGRTARCHMWSLWTGPGAGGAREEAVLRNGYRGISPAHGAQLFAAALAQEVPDVLIGLNPTNPRIAAELDDASMERCEVVVSFRGAATVQPTKVRTAVTTALGGDAPPVVVEQLSGWVDAVPDDGAEPPLTADADAPRGDTELVVAQAWRELLGTPSVRREDHFFDVGGNSMVAIRLVHRLNQLFDTELAVNHIYEHPTVKELAMQVRGE